jgi:heterotetrameric sarcosine oxidase gamma subunit
MTVLLTFSDLPVASPLAGILPDQSADFTDSALGLADITGRALLHVRGDAASAALQWADMKIGEVAARQDGLLARLRRDEFTLLTRTPRESFAHIESAIGEQRVTLTDITHGRCGLLLVGKDAPNVLPKVCGLNFADGQFPNLHAASSSLAKVRALIIRADISHTPTYGLIVDRSLARYVWSVVFDAAREFGALALSQNSLNKLREETLW